MSPQVAKFVALGVAIAATVIGAFVPGTQAAMGVIFGIAVGKEFLEKTGSVSATSHPDDLRK